MNRHVFLFAICFSAAVGPSAAQDIDCDTDTSQMALNHCTYESWQEEDKKLNGVWARIQRSFTNDDYDRKRKSALLASQRAWLAYRDADCDGAVGQEWEGGSGRPMAVYTCSAELTRRRTQLLENRYLNR